jgi:hypothetical protein
MRKSGSRKRGRIARWTLLAFAAVALFGVIGSPVANATTNANATTKITKTALINESTVSGGASSEEATFLTAQGFTVTVVSDSDWALMTQAQFGAYDLLVVGDPSCGSLPPGLIASAPVFGPVVLGMAGGRTMAGNRTIVGTDPALHSSDSISSPRAIVIKDGLAFAGGHAGTTGFYFDTTCAGNYSAQGPETLAILAQISAGSGVWTEDDDPPCGGAVSLIASNPAFSDLTTADLQGWGCSVHESWPTFPSDFSALAVATDTLTHPTCGTDPSTGASACGEAYVLIAGAGIVVRSGEISLTPTTATNPPGTDHTVTAHVTEGGLPAGGKTVTFTVTGQNAGATGTCNPTTCVTDSLGNVSFTYHDSNGPGTDTIKASFTDTNGSLQSATASKDWGTGGPPMCVLTATIAGPPEKKIEVTISSTVGLGSIVVTETNNANTPVPPFSVGATSPVVVTATKIDQTLASQVAITVTDTAGVVTKCDPVWPGKKAAVHKKLAKKAPARARHFNRNSR